MRPRTGRYLQINNPVSLIDPDGLVVWKVIPVIGAGAAWLYCQISIERFMNSCRDATQAARDACKPCEEFEPHNESKTCLDASWSGPCGGDCKPTPECDECPV